MTSFELILAAEEIRNNVAGRQFSVNEGNVRAWSQQKEALFKMQRGKTPEALKLEHLPTTKGLLRRFVEDQQESYLPVAFEVLQLKTLELARDQEDCD